jgi:hypothetical protein
MNIKHEWSKLRLNFDNNTYVATLKYINPINPIKHVFLGMTSKFKIPPFTRNVCRMMFSVFVQ